MPTPHGGLVSVGVLLMTVGGLLFLCVWSSVRLLGLALGILGFLLLVFAFCLAMKSHHVAGVPGHFLLHPRTGTRYSHHQAIAIQRRLDRIRRAVEEEAQPACPPPPQDTSLQSLPGTPPPWEMEPPPSYETVMKTTQCTIQHL